jgi:flagellar operon protein
VPAQTADTSESSFAQIFASELQTGDLHFSAHARTRLMSRDMPLSTEDISRLDAAVRKAESKGAQESLVLLRDMAFIVSIPNRTVITAMPAGMAKEPQIFTNIDSAVFA